MTKVHAERQDRAYKPHPGSDKTCVATGFDLAWAVIER